MKAVHRWRQWRVEELVRAKVIAWIAEVFGPVVEGFPLLANPFSVSWPLLSGEETTGEL